MNIPRRWQRRVRGAWRGIQRAAGLISAVAAAVWFVQRGRLGAGRRVVRTRPKQADERTIRRIAEAQAGGISSQESDARYESGEHPGGLHGKAVRPPPDAEIYEIDEPDDRTLSHRGSRRTMSSMRR
ncbi:hypothetical protein [Polyangium jinanense]|uniref:Uncharacterized protein n=1 Tax=Polyangium jinanense TaxID=2829994 RepID=A0A9X3X6X2_9BACT|nr:hypothetical protein [Polyangium jinanense]MDC3962700.1 hypothetical protein [Polyangium jinanense]MDC3984914.1 hypothetical protein [Polyangium jinanense]